MKVQKTKLKDCLIIEPEVFSDERGFFLETYNEKLYLSVAEIEYKFVQDNHSYSKKGTLRGLHFQTIRPQGKLVRVTSGEVFDVVVDIRKKSPSYGRWESFLLSETNKKQLWVPPGFAHGFLTISEFANFEYKCTDFYDPSNEGCIRWNDPELAINWPIKEPVLSKKDMEGRFFKDIY